MALKGRSSRGRTRPHLERHAPEEIDALKAEVQTTDDVNDLRKQIG